MYLTLKAYITFSGFSGDNTTICIGVYGIHDRKLKRKGSIMKKIGIVTLHGYNNYGNKLQNYALLKTIENLGFSATTTIIKNKSKKRFLNNVKHIIKLGPGNLIKRILNVSTPNAKKLSEEDRKTYEERVKKFKLFSETYLNESFYYLNDTDALQRLDEYSFFVTGSDQVWNPSIYKYLDIFFLSFTLKNKRIAYAPSISRDKLPSRYKISYKKWLEGMSAISIREEAGAKIINEITGIDVPVLVDPTMLLSKEEWISVSKQATNRTMKEYLLTYFLGGPSEETLENLKKIADKKNMTIINLGDITETESFTTGPSEFLDYINNASAFFTDSFHGVVFSIIFQTPFVVYERKTSGSSMYSRIETLLDKFDMRNREANFFDDDIFSMDFSGSNKVLLNEYEQSISYLKDAFKN